MGAVKIDTWESWLVTMSLKNIEGLWTNQPTFMMSQAVYVFGGLLTLVHSLTKGGRWPYFWLATVLHGVFSDNFWHFAMPEYDNFWHSQTPIMFLGARLPLHIILLYPVFIYNAAYAVSRLNLSAGAEAMAVGLVTILIDIPYDIVAVKFVHWTWHDTDPNVYDRHYWVPWNSFYFHATFAASLYYIFHVIRRAPQVKKWESAGFVKELMAMIFASLLGMPGGVLLFVPIYHPFHDVLEIHSEVTFFLLLTVFLVFILKSLVSKREPCKEKLTLIDYLVMVQLAVHYLLYLVFVAFFNPEKEVSVGFHQPVGPCNEKVPLVTALGQTIYKGKYLCAQNYDEGYFNFCGQMPPSGADWYRICGTPFENRAEYITILSTILVASFVVFYSLFFKSGASVPVPAPSPSISHKKKKN